MTGGAGFIGSNLVRRLLSLDARVRIVDNLSRSSSDRFPPTPGAEDFFQLDLTDRSASFHAFDGIDVAFHLASRVGAVSYYEQRPFEVLSNNILIDSNVIAAARSAGIPRMLYASSVFIYPAEKQSSPDSPPLREGDAHPASPPLSYGWAKVVGEKLMEYSAAEGGQCRSAILRLMGVYGPGQDMDLERGSIIPVLVRRAVEHPRLPFVIRGNGQETRSYCFIDDVIDAMLRAVEKLGQRPVLGPLNIGSESRIRIIDLAREIAELSGKHMEIEFLPGVASVWGQTIDCSAARKQLDGWEPRVSLREGLVRTFDDIAARLESAGGYDTMARGVEE